MTLFDAFGNGKKLTDVLEMKTGERLEGTVFSFKSLTYKVAVAVFNVFVLNIVGWAGYNKNVMTEASEGGMVPLITSTTKPSIINGVNYTHTLNTIFFILTAFAAVGLILQVIPMLFYKVDEKEQEDKIKEYREKKALEMQAELDKAIKEK